MRERGEHFMAFFVRTFLLVNFIVGSLTYVFASDRVSPVPEPRTMLFIAVVIGIIGLIERLSDRRDYDL
jgi:hypothetical protein